LLHDYPDTIIEFEFLEHLHARGVPAAFGGDRDGVVCRIIRPGMPVIEAVKEVPLKNKAGNANFPRTPETWASLQTMALGRALKRLGMPDDTVSLRTLLLWRQRNAEVAAIGSGQPVEPQAQIGAGAPQVIGAALAAAPPPGSQDGAEPSEGRESAPGGASDDSEPCDHTWDCEEDGSCTCTTCGEFSPPPIDDADLEATLGSIRRTISALQGPQAKAWSSFKKSKGFPASIDDYDGGEAADAMAFLDELAEDTGS
jgi:hypothetical protein